MAQTLLMLQIEATAARMDEPLRLRPELRRCNSDVEVQFIEPSSRRTT
jgi:hypothetical protein